MPNPSEPQAKIERAGLELWGGIECTIARIGDLYRDELEETGHAARPGDLDLVAALGIRTLRYPVLWEAIAPDHPARSDWRWTDVRLGRLRALGIRPIAGLTHHGAGPRYTNLLDPAYPDLLAAHAGRVAARYPWLDAYTPVNEPLTTARFSALYGHWYPHRASEGDFLCALVAQCRATVLAMRAIRRVSPRAILVQTEDIGRVFAVPELAYQADYENERRWLSLDLLAGRVDRHHPWRRRLARHGIGAEALAIFADRDGTPDIVGMNHYLTSERFLDTRTHLYPEHFRGGNGRHAYADVEAVRTRLPRGELGPAARLAEVWERYRLPVAITEVHHGASRDEQLRWLAEMWRAAETLRGRGADIRAVTLWALFGSVDWNSLLLRRDGAYEPGAFDIRGDVPRPTALAAAARRLAAEGRFDHPVLDVPGWWRRHDRFYAHAPARQAVAAKRRPRGIVIAGPQSALADAFVAALRQRGLPARRQIGAPVSGPPDPNGDGTAWALVDLAPGVLRRRVAAACAAAGLRYMAVLPGSERPVTAGQVAPAIGGALVIRPGLPFGISAGDGLVAATDPVVALVRRLLGGVSPIPDGLVSPIYLPDLAHAALDLMIDGATGTWTLANATVGWDDVGRRLMRQLAAHGFDIQGHHEGRASRRAVSQAVVGNAPVPSLDVALGHFVARLAAEWASERRSAVERLDRAA